MFLKDRDHCILCVKYIYICVGNCTFKDINKTNKQDKQIINSNINVFFTILIQGLCIHVKFISTYMYGIHYLSLMTFNGVDIHVLDGSVSKHCPSMHHHEIIFVY